MLIIVICAAGGFFMLQSKQVAPTEVYIWANDGKETKVITEEDLAIVTIPADGVQESMIKVGSMIDVGDKKVPALQYIVGKAVDTAVYAGEYVTANALVQPEDLDIFAVMDLSNYRKYALSTNVLATAGGNVEAGDKVDLIQTMRGSIKDENGMSQNWTSTKIFMENVLVYKVLTGSGTDHVDSIEHEGATYTTPATIILAVTPSQLEEIITRRTYGEITFVTRFDASEDANSNGYTIQINQDGYVEFIPDHSYEIQN